VLGPIRYAGESARRWAASALVSMVRRRAWGCKRGAEQWWGRARVLQRKDAAIGRWGRGRGKESEDEGRARVEKSEGGEERGWVPKSDSARSRRVRPGPPPPPPPGPRAQRYWPQLDANTTACSGGMNAHHA
jgi:hypothetical protein